MNELLEFEKEKCQDLQRFPMFFRLKLDLSGIKLSKRDWNSFDLPAKERLLRMPCETSDQITAFRKTLKALLRDCNSSAPDIPPAGGTVDRPLPWTDSANVPELVQQQVQSLTSKRVSLERWAQLSDLQRFALIKLTQPGHAKEELHLVLQEFAVLTT